MSYVRLLTNEVCWHWGRFVKNSGGQTKILGEKMVITDESMGVYQFFLGGVPRLPLPKSMPMFAGNL